MAASNMPTAEVDLDEDLVRGLLLAQHPDLADLPLALVANGWDNAVFRLGDDLLVRLPRRQLAADLVRHEQRWLPELAVDLPLPVPVPLRTGGPQDGYPWHWSICQWIGGDTALVAPFTDLLVTARELGAFLAAFRRPAPPDAPVNPWRGIPLAEREHLLLDRVAALGEVVDGRRILELWSDLVVTPPWAGPLQWVHGDLHPGNLIVDAGRLAGIIDFGDLTAGDPATDLAVGWMLFGPEHRAEFRAAAGGAEGVDGGVDDNTWRRARAWALALGVATLGNSADNPAYADHGARTLAAALDDPG